MLSRDQHDRFRQLGLIRLHGAIPPTAAKAMRDVLWRALARKHGVLEDDVSTWELPTATGLQRLRKHEVFKPLLGSTVHSALDDLMGPGCWERPRHPGSLLTSFPLAANASSRPNFHTDFPYDLAPDRIAGALIFAFLGAVPAGAGGTLVVEGSHRVVRSFIGARPHLKRKKMKVARKALLASQPFLKELHGDWSDADWVRTLPRQADAGGGTELRVTELTGQPGDVVICHPWMLHSPAPNRGSQPRFMAVQRIRITRHHGEP